jgi:hypothetical protein
MGRIYARMDTAKVVQLKAASNSTAVVLKNYLMGISDRPLLGDQPITFAINGAGPQPASCVGLRRYVVVAH